MKTLEAAYHEAGHAVVAHHSRFHRLNQTRGGIALLDKGEGFAEYSLSQSKRIGSGPWRLVTIVRTSRPGARDQTDPAHPLRLRS